MWNCCKTCWVFFVFFILWQQRIVREPPLNVLLLNAAEEWADKLHSEHEMKFKQVILYLFFLKRISKKHAFFSPHFCSKKFVVLKNKNKCCENWEMKAKCRKRTATFMKIKHQRYLCILWSVTLKLFTNCWVYGSPDNF